MYIKLQSDTWQNYRIHLDPWWNSTYDYRRTITINKDYVDTTLSGFPVKVHITNTTNMQVDYDDIRFVSSDNITIFPYEFEKKSINDLTIWVNVSNIKSGTDTKFNMYYGNAVVTSGENINAVWDENYLGVWHMDDSSGGIVDSTVNGVDGTEVGSLNYLNPSNTGYAIEFLGTDDYFSLGVDEWAESDFNGLTMLSYAKFDDATVNEDLFNIEARVRFYKSTIDGNIGGIFYNSIDGSIVQNVACTLTDWTYCVIRADGSNYDTWVNEGSTDNDAVSKFPDFDDCSRDVRIGVNWDGTNDFNGFGDEFRVSGIRRNDSWVKASYHSMNQTTGFLTISGEYIKPSGCQCIITNPFPLNNSIDMSSLLVNISVLVNSTLGCTIDYVNISLLNSSHNVTVVSNGTFYLNFSSYFSLEGETSYTWYVNTSCNNSQNNTFFVFTTGDSCPSNCVIYALLISNQNKLNTLNNNLEMCICIVLLSCMLIIGCIFANSIKNKPLDQKQKKEKK